MTIGIKDVEDGGCDDSLLTTIGRTQKRFSPLTRQMFVSSGPIILLINAGAIAGFSAVALPQMSAQNSTIRIDDGDASWIASIMVLPMPIGCVLGGIFMEWYGRRTTHLIACLPLMVGWGIIALAGDIVTLLVGRFITGICNGFLGPISSVYIGETAEPRYRGFLLTSISFAIASGLLIEHVLGTFLTWQTTCLVCAAMPVIAAMVLCFAPESPSWLAKKGDPEEATRAFFWCRGRSPEATRELKALLDSQKEEEARVGRTSPKEILKGLTSRTFLKPLAILVVFFATTQWSGMNAISFYSINFIEDSVGESLNAYASMLIIDGLRLIMSIVACVLTKFFGRRPLVLTSGFGTSTCLFILCAFLYASKRHPELARYNAFVLVCLVGYIAFITIGLAPLCWTVNGELFPLSMRSYGSAMIASFAFLVFFSVVKTVHSLFRLLGVAGTLLTYACVALIGTTILSVVLPETKDKTLQDIEDYFKSHKQRTKTPTTTTTTTTPIIKEDASYM